AARTDSAALGTVTYATSDAQGPLRIIERYHTDGRVLDWCVDLASSDARAIHVGDLAITVPVQGPVGENPAQIFERGFLKHQFVSGYGSFFYYVRASGAPPFLLVTVRPGTKLEYTAAGGGAGRGAGPQVYVHSSRSGGAETRGTWRQPHTALELAPAGKPGS